jgi:diacylglycerol kinase family enzyme
VLVILNPVAAQTESADARKKLIEGIASRGLLGRIVETTAGTESQKIVGRAVLQALEGGCKRFVAVGGDGTAAMTAAHLMGRPGRAPQTTLAIVPTGTANILARELGIPMSLDGALALALDGDHAIELDAIQTAERPVFTQVGIGLDAQMIRHTSREDQIQKGRMAYVIAFLRRAVGHRSEIFDLEIDGKTTRVRALQIIVANIGALGAPPFTWGPGIDPSDGSLDLCVYAARTVKQYLTQIGRLLTVRHQRDSQTRYFRVERRVIISSRRPVLVQGDGEILGKTPITLEVIPRALRFRVPKDVEDLAPMVGTPTDPVPQAPRPVAGVETSITEPAETINKEVDMMVAQHSRTWVLQGRRRHPFTFLSALDVAAEALIVLWATMLTVNYPLKRMFRRRRPFIAFVQARVLGPRPKDFSFPSGHTAAAFAGALLFGTHLPLWSPLFYALACVVGFARIYLGVHYPIDVIIGAIVGTFLAGGYLALLRMVLPALGHG